MNLKDIWAYIRTGHNTYLIYPISMIQFALIAYEFSGVSTIFTSPLRFMMVGLVIYVPVVIVLGVLHQRYQVETDMRVHYAPIMDRLDKIEELIRK